MNALATDQARRIAALVAQVPAFAGMRVGLYVGVEWTGSPYEPLAEAAPSLEADEEFHTKSGFLHLRELCATPEGKAAVQALVAAKPQRLTIVSCDPATLARDVEAFASAGYAIRSLDVLELFPQTSHVESIVALQLSRPSRQKPA